MDLAKNIDFLVCTTLSCLYLRKPLNGSSMFFLGFLSFGKNFSDNSANSRGHHKNTIGPYSHHVACYLEKTNRFIPEDRWREIIDKRRNFRIIFLQENEEMQQDEMIWGVIGGSGFCSFKVKAK
jgi:hypothetical protein